MGLLALKQREFSAGDAVLGICCSLGCIRAGSGWELQNAFNVLCVEAAKRICQRGHQCCLLSPACLTGAVLVLFPKQISELNVDICHRPWGVGVWHTQESVDYLL